MWHANNGDFADGIVLEQRGLDIGRIDILPARNNHVLLAIDEIQEAVLIETPDIAGAQPALSGRMCPGCFLIRCVVRMITGHHEATVADNLAGFADR